MRRQAFTQGLPFGLTGRFMQVVAAILHWMGYGLCHQLPERSFSAGGIQVPVCARDTGIYIGVVVSLALISVLHGGRRPMKFPRWSGWTAIALMIGAMGLDGTTEYAGLRTTTNELRLITGLLAGFAIGAIIVPMLNDEMWRVSSPERVLDTPLRLAVWLAAVPAAYAVVWWLLPLLGVVYPILVAVAIVATLAAVNLIVVCMLPPFERRATSLVSAAPQIAIAVGIAFAEMWLAGLLRDALTVVAARGLR
jgi:uncharacterized membrane protein